MFDDEYDHVRLDNLLLILPHVYLNIAMSTFLPWFVLLPWMV